MKTRKQLISIFMALALLTAMILPASASIAPTSFVAVLAPGGSASEDKIVSIPELPPQADVVFAFDLTGSMEGIINTAKTNAGLIMGDLNAIPGVSIQYGVMSYMDYPDSYDTCGYGAIYGDPLWGDYAYSLDQSVTSDVTAVSSAINGLSLGSGGDLPQDYTRIFYESYADPNVDWRPGAKRILFNFGDDVPHDCNLEEGISAGSWTTGCDPGRDEIAGTSDDLDLQTVLAEMATEGVVLLEAHTTHYANAYWNYWTGLTGGDVFITTSSTLVDDIVTAVNAELTDPVINGLHLEASFGYETWLTSVVPAAYGSVPTGADYDFNITITVPDGTTPGIYNFMISAVDGVGVNYGDQDVTIVVYDPSAGFVTGGGTIDSPAGAYVADPNLTGKANFGFVAKYKKGAEVPEGSTEFQFQTGDLNFHISSYDWLLVTGSDYARFKGSGTINGEGDYKFMIWAGDDDPDTFRIKIWEEIGGIEDVIYDNGMDQAINGGSIVIHTKK